MIDNYFLTHSILTTDACRKCIYSKNEEGERGEIGEVENLLLGRTFLKGGTELRGIVYKPRESHVNDSL